MAVQFIQYSKQGQEHIILTKFKFEKKEKKYNIIWRTCSNTEHTSKVVCVYLA